MAKHPEEIQLNKLLERKNNQLIIILTLLFGVLANIWASMLITFFSVSHIAKVIIFVILTIILIIFFLAFILPLKIINIRIKDKKIEVHMVQSLEKIAPRKESK